MPAPTPVSTAVFVGAYDPSRLGFKDKMLTALPASPVTTNLWYSGLMKATTRISKEERRREIVEAATGGFAIGDLHGTPVDAIAKRSASRSRLFQLFGTKKALFIAAVQRTFERTVAGFRTAAAEAGEDAGPAEILMAMGVRVPAMLDDRSLLLMQMQAYAACGGRGDPGRGARRDAAPGAASVQSASGRAGGGDPRGGSPDGMLLSGGGR